jgi:capsular exopolysaccharide synthesis family protein
VAPEPPEVYQYGTESYPEYQATEVAPAIVPLPFSADERSSGFQNEPTRIYMQPEERQFATQAAEAYQTLIEQVYPAEPRYERDLPYAPQQAYAPHAPVYDGTIPPERSLAVVEAPQASRVVVVYPTAVRPPSPELIMVQRPDTTTADQFRMLRFKLVDRPTSQVIAVTGPTRGVGTSVTAANLALSLAEAGRARVVIVDTDVRAARQGEIFGIESDVGLTLELERRHANPDVSARVVAVAASMAILPAGRDVPNPTAMLGSDVMARFLEDLRFMYDHVILDVAPVLERSDAAAINNLVDVFVIVAMSGVTSTDEIEKAEEKLPRKKVAGVVLNSVPKQPRGLFRGLFHFMGSSARRKRYLKRGKLR